MNQLRRTFGLSVRLSNRVPPRGSSIARSAGTSGKDRRRSGDSLVAAGDGDDSPELKLCGRSYAKLIADYGREIEERSVAAQFSGDGKAGGTLAGLFSGTAFQRLARVSSLVRIKTGSNGAGPSLCTKSSSGPPLDPAKTGDDRTRGKASQDDEDALDGASGRAKWLEKVVKAHRAKRAMADEGRNSAHALVQKMAKTTPIRNASSNDFVNVEGQISSVKKNPDVPRSDTRNVSVVVKPLKKSDKVGNATPMADGDQNNAMLVTLTEESKHSSTSGSHPLRHIDLRINGKPASGVDTVISKVEKLDVVSSAEKIEIRIPVLSEAASGDKLRAANSTINVYISSRREDVAGIRESNQEVGRTGASGSGRSRSGLSHQSTFVLPSSRNFRRSDKVADRSRVVPWWTTEDSFRRSENAPPGSAEVAPITQSPETKTSVVAAAADAEWKEVVSDSVMRAKSPVTKPSSPRQPSKSARNGTSAISKIIGKESLRRSEQQQDGHRSPLGRSKSDATPAADSDTGVKSTASNEPKKDASSVAVGWTMSGKSAQARGTPTPDKTPPLLAVAVAAPAGEPKTASKSTKPEDAHRNNNLSSANDSGGRIHAKPISEIGALRTKADTHGVTSPGQVSRIVGSDRVGSMVETKLGTKPLQEVSSESERNDAPRPPGTHGKTELLPSTRSPAEPAKPPRIGRGASIKPNDSAVCTAEKLSKAKNSASTMRPIEKKKDGTLIDYGATVTTRKKLERKLSGSRSTNGVQRKKITEQEEPVVVATIKEVIPRRSRDVRGDAFNRKSEEPGSRQNGPDENRRRTHVARDHCRSPQKKFNRISPKGTTNEPNESGTPRTQLNEEKINSEASNESRVVETVTPDKKLLYAVWLRRFKERTGQDPDPTKDPKSRGA